MTTDLSPKRLEFLKELLPGARRVVFYGDPEDGSEGWRLTQEIAPKLGLAIQMVPYKDRDSIPAVSSGSRRSSRTQYSCSRTRS